MSDTGKITRRSDWFVTKSPAVWIGPRQVKYLISFSLPRFCDQSLDRSRKERFYPRVEEPWLAKLDTVIHELYHIDPEQNGTGLERGWHETGHRHGKRVRRHPGHVGSVTSPGRRVLLRDLCRVIRAA